MGSNRRELILGLVAILCISAFVGDKFVVSPLYNQWKSRGVRIAELKKDLERGNMLMDREDTIKSRWKTMKQGSLSSNVSEAENQVLNCIDRWATTSGVIITSQKIDWSQSGEVFRKAEFRTPAQGDMASIARFLYELENEPLALNIENILVTSRDETGSNLTLDLRFSVLTLVEEAS